MATSTVGPIQPDKPSQPRIALADLLDLKRRRRKFSMLTAYDYPTARIAQSAGIHSLLVGDSLGCVVLGLENTRSVTLELMLPLAQAVRRGAPAVFLVGDLPFECVSAGPDSVARAARRFVDEAGCDAAKVEVASSDMALVEAVATQDLCCIAHLGLRPQSVTTADGYKAQARDQASIDALARDAKRMVDAGAQLLLLEAVPNEASLAVLDAVRVPVIGCGAGPACDGHVVVTHDMIGLGAARPPRFVPILANVQEIMDEAMRRFTSDIASGAYPAPRQTYSMSTSAARTANDSPKP